MSSNLNENARYLILSECETGQTSSDENLDVYDVKSIEDSSIEHDFKIRFFHRPILCFQDRKSVV